VLKKNKKNRPQVGAEAYLRQVKKNIKKNTQGNKNCIITMLSTQAARNEMYEY
jgi:hypothetical protein